MRLLERVRRPEYTGDNRCWPCTLVNTALVTVLAIALAFLSPLVALAVVAGGAAAIVLRGYVVPYTPQFAPDIVAAIPGGDRLFDHGASSPTSSERTLDPEGDRTTGGLGDEDADGERVLQALVDAGVLVGTEDLNLADDFREDWRAHMDELQRDDLPDACVDAAPDVGHAALQTVDDQTWVVVSDEERSVASETWLSVPIAIADVAAIRALTDRSVDADTAADAAAALRLFLDECPECGGDVVETSGDGCCGGFGPTGPDRVLACADCDQRIASLE